MSASTDVGPPEIRGEGTFVLDLERHMPEGDGPGNVTKKRAPGSGIFVNFVNVTFGVEFNGTKEDGSLWPNTTVAETHFAVRYCPGALFFPDAEHCADKFDVLGNFRPVFYGDEGAGNVADRYNSDGVAKWNGEFGRTGDAGPVIVQDVGWILVEAFTLLLDTSTFTLNTQTGEPIPEIVAISTVAYGNFTVVPDSVKPILDPPQDFFDADLNVTLETPTNNSHVFFTLQPPFVNDKNGTWCPHMGVWCSNYPHEPEFHAVPNQPPNFWYSQRGMFNRLFDVPYYHRWNTTVPDAFPQMNLTLLAQYYMDICTGAMGVAGGDCALEDAAIKLMFRLEHGYGLINGSLPNGLLSGMGGSETARYHYSDSIRDRQDQLGPDALVDGFDEKNISLYPQYTFEKPPGVWLQFRPITRDASGELAPVEHFHVDVYTCFNVSYAKPKTLYRTEIEYRSVTNALGVVEVRPVELIIPYNITVNTTEADCTHVMQAPARNPCPWSRDCRLMGEVSFKLRAMALHTDYVDSATSSGLYTFITNGAPRWMNTRDECGGFRQSTVHPHLMYAVSDHTIWEILAPYDCPPGYHWASTDEVLTMLEFEGMDADEMWEHNISHHTWQDRQKTTQERTWEVFVEESGQVGSTQLTYEDSCGWDGLFWEGKQRRYFRFSDSGPRYVQFQDVGGAQWPEEGYFFRGDYPTTVQSHPEGMDVYHSHLTAWYWYQHNENFTMNWQMEQLGGSQLGVDGKVGLYKGPAPPCNPDEQAGLYCNNPTNATWATKSADSMDYAGLEVWTGDNLGHQPKFAGAVCRTNGDWSPPRVVLLGPLILTLEVHDPYIEFGARAWDPVDDVWYPLWKTTSCDGVDDDIDDCVVRISGHVDYDNVGIYHMYYDATDLHGNHARQQMRTIIILDRTIPIITVTQGIHQRVCEPWTEEECTEADKNYPFRVPLSDDGYEVVSPDTDNLRCANEAWRRDDTSHDDPAQCAALARADPRCGEYFSYWRGGQCACVEVGDDCSTREYSGLMRPGSSVAEGRLVRETITDTAIYKLQDLVINTAYRKVTNQDQQGLACPPRHTCDHTPGGYMANRGERTRGTEITIEAGTRYVELGATATDNYKDNHALTRTIETTYEGPLKHFESVERPYPIYPYWYMVNLAHQQVLEQEALNAASGLGLSLSGGVGMTTAQDVIEMGCPNNCGYKIKDGQQRGYQQLVDCGFEGYPDNCGFEWSATQVGITPDIETFPDDDPFMFNTTNATVLFPEGYEKPTTLTPNTGRQMAEGLHAVMNTQTVDQPDHIAFDFVNWQLPGVYQARYDVVDDYNNTGVFKTRTITVKDTTPPVLHLIGDPIMIVRYNETFVDPGAFATDLGDDYYYELNRLAASEDIDANNQTFREKYCNDTACTLEHENATISDKIVTRVHHERLECEVAPIFAERNQTEPLCLHAGGGMPMTLSCPNVSGHVTHISGYNFISFGRPEGECFDETQPLVKSEYCQYTSEEEGGLAADEAVFNELCLGQRECTLMASWEFWGLAASDPCPGAEKWLKVEATCDYTYDGDQVGSRVECGDEEVQIPKLGLSGQPPLLGELNFSLPGVEPGQYPLSRFNGRYAGTWDRMDDFLSRLDPELGTLDERYQHQDIMDENVFMRERIGNEVIVNTTVNTTILGLYIITYDVTDMAANEATQICRFVIVQDDSELYQNSIQQVFDGTPGTFTGGVLPHEAGGSIRVSTRQVDLSRNRRTKSSTEWGVHTPSSAAVDGHYGNSYMMPFSEMDEYNRSLAEDHIPHIFMSGPSIWNDFEPPQHHQWWMVHLASRTDNPQVTVYMRDCCTDQFGVLEIYIGDYEQPPFWDGEQIAGTEGGGSMSTDSRDSGSSSASADGTDRGVPTNLPNLCAYIGYTDPGGLPGTPDIEDGGVYTVECQGTGEYLWVAGTSYIHFAEVEVVGNGGGPGQGNDLGSPEQMSEGRRHDVGLHQDGAQYAITVPVANVTTSWWVGVPFVTGRQMVIELNTTWEDENRSLSAYVHHAVHGGDINGTEVWNMTETGERRRATDGFIYEGETAHTAFQIRELPSNYIPGAVLYKLTYAILLSLDGSSSGSSTDTVCVCDEDLRDAPEGAMPCEVQCPPDPNDPYLFNIHASAALTYVPATGAGVTGGEDLFITTVSAQMPVHYWQAFADWGADWVADTVGVDPVDLTGFVSYNYYHWRDINLQEEPPSSLKLETYPTGVARTVIGCSPSRFALPEEESERALAPETRPEGGGRRLQEEQTHGDGTSEEEAPAEAEHAHEDIHRREYSHLFRPDEAATQGPPTSRFLEASYDSEPHSSAGNVGLTEGAYFITVKAEPIVRMDSILRHDHTNSPDDIDTDTLREVEYQAVPYSLRTTFVEPILLPSATDVNATTGDDIKTIYYFEVYLNQKVALELAGSDSPYEGTAAILSYEECTDRADDWGYLGKGRLQTYKIQQNRPAGYDFLMLCPAELSVGRYYVEMRSEVASNYTLRLTEYTPYCPSDCGNSTGNGFCDCTILRCICNPGFFGDDCGFQAAKIEIDSFPFQAGLPYNDRPTGWDSDLDGTAFPTYSSVTLDHHGGGQQGDSVWNNWPNVSTEPFNHRGTRFNQTCPPGYVLIGLNGSYYDYENPHLFEKTTQRVVRRVDLVCGLLLGPSPESIAEGAPDRPAMIGTRSNETVLVSNNHARSIYARTLTRYSYRQEYLSPEQLDLDCVTPGGKSHLDECRLLHGIWSKQQTMYTHDEPVFSWSCGPNELFVGQTIDVLSVNQTCDRDGFGCQPHFRVCNYTMANETTGEVLNLTLPCHELCQVEVMSGGNTSADQSDAWFSPPENSTSSLQWVLCNGTTHTSPWALDDYNRYWPGNDYDWRSMKYFGEFTNDYYATFEDDALHAEVRGTTVLLGSGPLFVSEGTSQTVLCDRASRLIWRGTLSTRRRSTRGRTITWRRSACTQTTAPTETSTGRGKGADDGRKRGIRRGGYRSCSAGCRPWMSSRKSQRT